MSVSLDALRELMSEVVRARIETEHLAAELRQGASELLAARETFHAALGLRASRLCRCGNRPGLEQIVSAPGKDGQVDTPHAWQSDS